MWEGPASVIEEISIGVDAGPDELMLGSVDYVYEHAGTIYVVDSRVPTVRMFELDGRFVGELGERGVIEQFAGEPVVPVLVVERFWDPIAVDPGYAAWYRAAYGDERPEQWPAFFVFTRAEPDEIWVTRDGPVERDPQCAEDLSSREAARAGTCWRATYIVDVFGDDGRFRGEIDLPDSVTPVPQWVHADGDMLIARALERDGVIRVKRFRIVRPPADR